MNDRQLLRYSRHILLDEIGIEGQERFLAARVLVVGAGGLGSPAAMYLAASGVGRIVLVDDDEVDLTNLQRQVMHTTERVGMPKVDSGRLALAQINPEVEVVALRERADAARLAELVRDADVVLDCSDNFATRHAVNRACVAAGVPLVSGAAIRFDGQLSVFDVRDPASPCYACLFPADSRLRGRGLQHHGRVRAPGRHRRGDAGGRGAQAAGRQRPFAGRAPAAAGRARDGMERHRRGARPRLPGLRQPALRGS
jgi:molybdopterin/thiamine biosynthesis adenylyltransferase